LASEQLDPTGLYFNRARYYSPGIGRFIGRDSDAGSPSQPLSENPYTYAWDNPTNLTDPSGNNVAFAGPAFAFCLEPVGWVVCGVGAAVLVCLAVQCFKPILELCGGFFSGSNGGGGNSGTGGGSGPAVADPPFGDGEYSGDTGNGGGRGRGPGPSPIAPPYVGPGNGTPSPGTGTGTPRIIPAPGANPGTPGTGNPDPTPAPPLPTPYPTPSPEPSPSPAPQPAPGGGGCQATAAGCATPTPTNDAGLDREKRILEYLKSLGYRFPYGETGQTIANRLGTAKGADFVAQSPTGEWLIAESKGTDIGKGGVQIRDSLAGLKK